MMRSDVRVQKSPRLPHDLRAVHAAPTHQTPRSSVRSTSAQRAQANSNQKTKGRNHGRITRWQNAMDVTERAYSGRVQLSTMLRHGS